MDEGDYAIGGAGAGSYVANVKCLLYGVRCIGDEFFVYCDGFSYCQINEMMISLK